MFSTGRSGLPAVGIVEAFCNAFEFFGHFCDHHGNLVYSRLDVVDVFIDELLGTLVFPQLFCLIDRFM